MSHLRGNLFYKEPQQAASSFVTPSQTLPSGEGSPSEDGVSLLSRPFCCVRKLFVSVIPVHIPGMYSKTALYVCFCVHTLAKSAQTV